MLGDIISREHSYMVRLLVILDQKLNLLKQDKSINYLIINDIVTYLHRHSEQAHHPKEDLIYHYFLEHYGENQSIANLAYEHQCLSEVTQEFASLLEMVLQDAVVPHDVFREHLGEFIHQQKKHLDFEEREILPLLKRHFTQQDWEQVEALWGDEDNDPLFGQSIDKEYQRLSEYMKAE
ncbi:hemerythrin domain-containing protein [Vibrio rumoiensis]|uniref:Hemerythrin domain-containing protein n=1 Tax=Vibrio rumoiensis TaxID=76258 RepID=A0ABW7ISC4_9VIBR|nr:hemerythrin domain-containing protein [Vibrio rumoiensis]